MWPVSRRSVKRVLIVTAADVEEKVLVEEAKQITRHEPQQLFFRDHTVHRLGLIGGVEVGMVRTEQGTLSPSASTLTLVDVIDDYQPEAIIMVGICFGLKMDEQAIGDILVSTQIEGYEHRKLKERGDTLEIIPRADRTGAATRLLDRCRAAVHSWQCGAVHFGLIVSGNTLSDASSFVAELRSLFPEAIGAEMEGTGLYASSLKRKRDWIMIKAICDWGERKTDNHQRTASQSAVRFALHVIGQGGLAGNDSTLLTAPA